MNPAILHTPFHEQGSPEWKRERAGCATASCFIDVMGSKAARQAYIDQLVCERITGEPKADVFSYSMQWGKDCEPGARALYQLLTGNTAVQVGFVKHPTLPWVGASPDSLVGIEGGLEIKSPYLSEIHLRTWLEGMPREHKPQVQGVMWVCELEWIDFISFDPRQPEHLRLYIERIARDDEYIAKLAAATRELLAEVKVQERKLHELGRALQARFGDPANQPIEGAAA